MNKIFTTVFTFVALSGIVPTATATEYNAEPPRKQSATYNEVENTVTISALAPTKTEYDWDNWYEPQLDLPYISYILIERHISGTGWDSGVSTYKVENPAVGEVFSYVDTEIAADTKYEYRLTTVVDETKGQYSSYASAYTGIIPGALKEFTATVANHETSVVDITVTAPETSVSGNPLTCDFNIEIVNYVDYQEIPLYTIENAERGVTYTWQDTSREPGQSCHYRAYARVNTNGAGERSEADTYVGLDIPGQPVNLVCVPDGETARISWEQPLKGYRGGCYNPEATTYEITRVYLDGTKEIAASSLKATDWIDNPGLDEACTVSYQVVASNSAGEGFEYASHDPISFGRPAALPFNESFANASLDHRGWLMETTQNDPYYTYKAWTFPESSAMYYFPTDETIDILPHDKDSGMAECLFYGHSEDGQTESLISPAINVSGVNEVIVKFYHYEVNTEASLNEITASTSLDNGTWEQIYNSEAAEDTAPGWHEVTLPVVLGGNTETLKVRIDAIRRYGPITDIFIDNISVADAAESGINDTVADANPEAPEIYYNIQGMRIDNPTAPGVYIVKKGNKTSKVLVK